MLEMKQNDAFGKIIPGRAIKALGLGLALCLSSLGPAVLAQTPAELELAQVNALTATCVNLIGALPTSSTQEVYEAQIVAAVEASGISGQLVQRALNDALKVDGLPAAAQAALRSVLSKGVGKNQPSTAALGNLGGGSFGDFGGGGGSDY